MTALHGFLLLNGGDECFLMGGQVEKSEKLVRLKKGSFRICYAVSVCLEGSGLD